jgi:hypothetical protein
MYNAPFVDLEKTMARVVSIDFMLDGINRSQPSSALAD